MGKFLLAPREQLANGDHVIPMSLNCLSITIDIRHCLPACPAEQGERKLNEVNELQYKSVIAWDLGLEQIHPISDFAL